MIKLVATLASLLLVACAQLPPNVAAIHIYKQDSTLIAGCTKLGPVSGTASGLDPDAAAYDAKNRMRFAAAALGADSIAFLGNQYSFPNVIAQGVALKCYESPSPKPLQPQS